MVGAGPLKHWSQWLAPLVGCEQQLSKHTCHYVSLADLWAFIASQPGTIHQCFAMWCHGLSPVMHMLHLMF